MLESLDLDARGDRLTELLRRYRAQESSMTKALQDLQAELEHWHREANFQRAASAAGAAAVLRRCADLQAEHDLLATELVHVRLAVAGTAEELADHERRSQHAGRRHLAALV